MAIFHGCILPSVCDDFAGKVVEKLSDTQRKRYGITNDNIDTATKAISDLVSSYVGRESDSAKRDKMLSDVDAFISDLDNYFSTVETSDEDYDEAKAQYDKFHEDNDKAGWEAGNIDGWNFDDSEKEQNIAKSLKNYLASLDKVIDFRETTKNGKTTSITFILKEPKKSSGKTAQQLSYDLIDNIKAIDSSDYPIDIEITDGTNIKYVRRNKDIPEGWQKTGRHHYEYNGKKVLVSRVTEYNPDTDFPLVSAPIGTHVDTVGRNVYENENREFEDDYQGNAFFNADGTLKSDAELQNAIKDNLGDIFTVQGLKNLIGDFQKLKEQFEKEWGKGLRFFSGEVKLFGKMGKDPDTGEDIYNIGKPDLLVVDKKGIIHVIDFKTYKMTDIRGYQTFDKSRGDKYGKQVSSYIRLLESYGGKVDNQAYVVQIDTWYDASDHGKNNRNEKGELKENRNDIYYNDEGYLGLLDDEGEKKISLGDYAENEHNPTREDVLDSESDKEILYMEPRLHVEYNEDKGFSDELAALRGGKDGIPFHGEISYEQQWEALSEDEKQNMKWLNGKPTYVHTAQSIVVLSQNDIESRPDIISSQEIQDVADLLMYRVSGTITNLARGVDYDDIPLSTKNEDGSTPLQGRKRSEIIRLVGIDVLINKAFNIVNAQYDSDFPTEEEYHNDDYDEDDFYFEDDDDYQAQKKFNQKAKWLIDHKEQLIMAGYTKLIALENCLIPVQQKSDKFNKSAPDVMPMTKDFDVQDDNGDNEATQTFIDLYNEGLTDVEAWMISQRNYSPKASLAQEVRRMFEDIEMTDDNGKLVMDPYGWGFSLPIDPTTAIQTVYDITENCETIEEMEAALKRGAKLHGNNWINSVLDKINTKGNENLRKKFYRHFRKDTLNYSICEVKFNKKTGKREVITRIINQKSAYQTIINSLSHEFSEGKVGTITIEGVTFSFVSKNQLTGKNELTRIGSTKNSRTVADVIKERIDLWSQRLRELYNSDDYKWTNAHERVKLSDRIKRTKQEKIDFIADQIQNRKYNGKTILAAITEILQGIGIIVPEDVVMNAIMKKLSGEITNNAYFLLDHARMAVVGLAHSKIGIPDSLSGKGNPIIPTYKPIMDLLAEHVQEHVEASCYQDGKTYYSFTNPSRLGHIIRNIMNAIDDEDKFEKYIKENFGRYTGWYKTVPDKYGKSKWLCDWIEQLTDESSDAKKALKHKCELSYIGTQYKNLGALGFQLSILHNYFGSRDEQEAHDNWAWFALPTMSNKPVNEFIRMRKYNNSDEIIDRVLMKTFQQEMNRIADVLHHYRHSSVGIDKFDLSNKVLSKGGWTDGEIEGLKDRIDNHSLTVEDIVRLGKLKSGAKFHFLWYMNAEIVRNQELAEKIVTRLNKLLDNGRADTGSADEVETTAMVREAIASNMEKIVNSELQRMRDIGLFDKEEKIINGKKVKVLKYQDEFSGNLGSTKYDNSPNAKVIDGKKESERWMENEVKNFIWQDIAANINIIQITGGDLAYFGDSINYQKRIAMMHSPGLKLMHDPEYDDGYLRSVHISDEKVRDEIKENTRAALEGYLDDNQEFMSKSAISEYKKIISLVLSQLTDALETDGQSYSCPTSVRKKLALQGEWDDTREKAYQEISNGNFKIEYLGVMLQPSKPFVTSDMAKYSGSTTMELRRVPLQDKNSEYLIILAEALARGAKKKSKLTAIYDFMEKTAKFGGGKHGIDTVHFESVNKVGKSGIIDINVFDEEFDKSLKDKHENSDLITSLLVSSEIEPDEEEARYYDLSDDDYNALLTEYMLSKIRRSANGDKTLQDQFDEEDKLVQEGTLKREEAMYNTNFVDTIPIEDYIIQQEVPAHLLEHEQLYGSQIRILGISDITPGTEFDVNGKKMSDKELVDEYKELHATNIRESFNDLMEELGLENIDKYVDMDEDGVLESIMDLKVGDPVRNKVLKNLAYIIQKELSKDAKYGLDVRRACSLQYDDNDNSVDFNVPLMDPIQSRRIQELLNSIIKKSINKQKINGGPVVQTTAYDEDLHIRFHDKNGDILKTRDELGMTNEQYRQYLKDKQAGIAYFECYMPVPNAALERLMIKEDGSMMTLEELQKVLPKDIWESMSKVIGYRIPTEDKYSMLPLKIVGFMPKAAGQVIMMPQEITYLTGSDFDIDKMYLMMKAFAFDISKETKDDVIKKYLQKHKSFKGIHNVAEQVMSNGNDIMSGVRKRWDAKNKKYVYLPADDITWTTGITRDDNWDKAQEFIKWYKNYLLSKSFIEYNEQHTSNKKDNRNARNNRILDLQWSVLTNKDTASKILNPGTFDDLKSIGRTIRVRKSHAKNPDTKEVWTENELKEKSNEELDAILENQDPHNTTLPSSKIYFQNQNMQGTQMTGIFANNIVSHAFCTFQKIGINLHKGQRDGTFVLDASDDNPMGILIGDPDNPTVLDGLHGHNGQLISKMLSSYLHASVDTAKDPVLKDLNINTFTGDIAMVLVRMGFDSEFVGYFLSQPVIVALSDLYFKNSTGTYYAGDTAIQEIASELGMKKGELYELSDIRDPQVLTRANLWQHLADKDYENNGDLLDFQKRVLKAFNALYTIAKDMRELTFCTKFNSVTNAGGPTIADTMQDLTRVNNFIEGIQDSVFYQPSNDFEDYTNPAEIFNNDPILKAFYETTIAHGGASEKIFRNFFPHYYKGFQNVLKTFQMEYTKGKKMSSKLYNQLLNDYIYYLLTYQNKKEGIAPTLPFSTKDKDRLVSGLVKDFREILKIKGRRPNPILDQSLGGNCLRIRTADEYLSKDILVFNSSQLNSDGQQKIKNAWSDLITMNDPNLSADENDKIRRFGVDLFFYTLMRNGFGFSPKTLMHLASVIVRYNARYGTDFSNYIAGLRNLKTIDEYLMGSSIDCKINIDSFCRQFIRNHATNRQLVPNIDFQNKNIVSRSTDSIEFGAPSDEMFRIANIILSGDTPYHFITVTRKEGNKLHRDLYELEEVGGQAIFSNGSQSRVRYKKSMQLGLANNFIEYNANDTQIKESYFVNMRDKSEDSLDDEISPRQQEGDEIRESQEPFSSSTDSDSWRTINHLMKNLEGPQKGKEGKEYRSKLRQAFDSAENNSELAQKFNELYEERQSKQSAQQKTMDEINRIYKEQDKCK